MAKTKPMPFLKKLVLSALLLVSYPAYSAPVEAAFCQTNEGEIFPIIYYSIQTDGVSATVVTVDGIAVEFSELDARMRLHDLTSSTMLFLSSDSVGGTAQGLLEGTPVSASCVDFSSQFNEALLEASPAFEVVISENRAEIARLREQVRTLQSGLSRSNENLAEKVSELARLDELLEVALEAAAETSRLGSQIEVYQEFMASTRNLLVNDFGLPDEFRQAYNELYFWVLEQLAE